MYVLKDNIQAMERPIAKHVLEEPFLKRIHLHVPIALLELMLAKIHPHARRVIQENILVKEIINAMLVLQENIQLQI